MHGWINMVSTEKTVADGLCKINSSPLWYRSLAHIVSNLNNNT